jgi:hypothetical protein
LGMISRSRLARGGCAAGVRRSCRRAPCQSCRWRWHSSLGRRCWGSARCASRSLSNTAGLRASWGHGVPIAETRRRDVGGVRPRAASCGCVGSPRNAAEGMARLSPLQWGKRAAAAMRRGLRAARRMGCAASGPPTIAQRARTFFHSETAHEGVAQLPGQAPLRDEVHRHLEMNRQGAVAQLRLLSRSRAGYVTSQSRDAQRTPEAQRHAPTTLSSTTADAIPLGQQW